MKKIILKKVWMLPLFSLVVSGTLFSMQHFERLLPAMEAEIAELCYMTGLTSTLEATVTPELAKQAAQIWLRPAGKQRWEATFFMTFSPEQQERIYALFRSLGFFSGRFPKQQQYAHACVLGATVPAMEKRILYLVELWNQGIRWDHVVLVTGKRLLADKVDLMSDGTLLPGTNESQMCLALWECLASRGLIPQDMLQVPLIAVSALRPTTEDIIEQLIGDVHHAYDGPLSYLFISSQPHVLYQELVITYVFRNIQTSIEVVGPAYEPTSVTNIGTLFDALARCLYVQNKLDMSTQVNES